MGPPYADVIESMEIGVVGTSASDALDKYGDLSNLLDQAESFGRGSNVTAVYYEYEPPGSGLANSVKAVILGPGTGGTFLTPPGDFGSIMLEDGFTIGTRNNPIYLSFVRRGLWLGADETETASASSGNPEVRTSTTFTDDFDILVPYDATVTFTRTGGFDFATMAYDGYMIFTNAANKLDLQEAEGLTLTNFTSTVVSGSSAGSVARMNTTQTSGRIQYNPISGWDTGIRTVQVFANVRNNSASSHTFTIYIKWNEGNLPRPFADWTEGRKVVIDTDNNDPQLIDLGLMVINGDINNHIFTVEIEASAAVTAGNEVDIDYICMVGIDDSTAIIGMNKWYNASNVITSWAAEITHRLDSNLDPLIRSTDTSTNFVSASYTGNPYLFTTGNVVSCIVLGHDTSSADWVMEDDGGGEITYTTSIVRTRAYLTPL
jgi:hypothetical protein